VKKSTIQALNTINSNFYNTIAQEFSDSRKYSWQGWEVLLPQLKEMTNERKSLNVLDIGCGNGRFATFLTEHLPDITLSYTGIDSNQKLLDIAQNKLSATTISFTLERRDIVNELLINTFLADQNKFDLIVAFGVVHHIPSRELRTSFFKTIKNHLQRTGIAVITLWNFMEVARMQKKQTAFTDSEINSDELEANDYLLSWDRGTRAYRYCHFTDCDEQLQLIDESNLTLMNTYQADGKEGTGNTYLVLK
jgi:2-polyprenyl-3-methyl-5-hydroxy-6-metoxy-1,4-benzoquinol methylase